MRIINGQWLSIARHLREAEEQKYRIIVAIAAMFDNVYPFMAAIKSLHKILQAGAQDAKSVLTGS